MKGKLAEFCASLVANRQKNEELSPIARASICTLVAAGQSERSVAELFHVWPSAVHRVVEHWKKNHTFDSQTRNGRPEALTRREKRYIICMVKKNRRIAQKALINVLDRRISLSTIKRCLRAYNMRKWKAIKRIPLIKEVAKDRYNFACDWLENINEFLRVCS